MATHPYDVNSLEELQSQPVFLSQFLQLTLPRLRARTGSASTPGAAVQQANGGIAEAQRLSYYGTGTLSSDSAPSSGDDVSYPAPTSWSAFLPSLYKTLSSLQGTEHILPPPAFRPDDLPIATMLPTVYLWCIVSVWQPSLRMWELDEFSLQADSESAAGQGAGQGADGDAQPEGRRILKVGDHLPEHCLVPWAKEGFLPRQVFYTVLPGAQGPTTLHPPDERQDAEKRGIKALILVEEPWNCDLSELDLSATSDSPTTTTSKAAKALRTLLSALARSQIRYAVLTTYDHWLFVRVDFNSSSSSGQIEKVELSPVVARSDRLDAKNGKTCSVFAAMWEFGRCVMAEP